MFTESDDEWSGAQGACFMVGAIFSWKAFLKINTQLEGWSRNPLYLLKRVWKCPGHLDGHILPASLEVTSENPRAGPGLRWTRHSEGRGRIEKWMLRFCLSWLLFGFEGHVPSHVPSPHPRRGLEKDSTHCWSQFLAFLSWKPQLPWEWNPSPLYHC